MLDIAHRHIFGRRFDEPEIVGQRACEHPPGMRDLMRHMARGTDFGITGIPCPPFSDNGIGRTRITPRALAPDQLGRAPWRDRVVKYVVLTWSPVALQKKTK